MRNSGSLVIFETEREITSAIYIVDGSLFLVFFYDVNQFFFCWHSRTNFAQRQLKKTVVKRKRENKKKIRWRRPNKKADNIVYCTFIVSNILLPSSMQSPLCQYIDGIQSFVVDVSKEQHDCLVIFHGIFRRFFFSLSCIRFCMKIMKIILRFHSLSNKCDHVVV